MTIRPCSSRRSVRRAHLRASPGRHGPLRGELSRLGYICEQMATTRDILRRLPVFASLVSTARPCAATRPLLNDSMVVALGIEVARGSIDRQGELRHPNPAGACSETSRMVIIAARSHRAGGTLAGTQTCDRAWRRRSGRARLHSCSCAAMRRPIETKQAVHKLPCQRRQGEQAFASGLLRASDRGSFGTDKVRRITGAARGIGLVTAKRFLADGFRVSLLDIDGETLGRSVAAIN